MKNAVILHGTLNSSKDNWFPWLKKQLEEKGYRVFLPDLPGADKPQIDRYNKFLLKNWEYNSETILIGHSSGAVATLGLLEVLPKKVVVKRAILVAAFKDDLNWKPTKELFLKPFDFEKIKAHCKEFVLISSDDDPYVSLEHGKYFEEKLGVPLVILKGQKHFSVESMGEKYKEFPYLLELVD